MTGRATAAAVHGPPAPVIALAWPKHDYVRALQRAGADPRPLDPAVDLLPGALDGCDGVLLTGGADVDPACYGERDRHPTVQVDEARDAYEIALTHAARDRGLPLLAICRGVQLLNVVAGGTLVQDIPSSGLTTLVHRRPKPPRVKATNQHAVRIAEHTRLASLLGAAADEDVPVNSRHHQCIATVAPGFVVSAVAPDGIVEAIETPSGPFCLGVQWHPENYWRTGRFAELFTGLIEAAGRARPPAPSPRSSSPSS
ncbi:MAG: gamma-glutamyl-gamma-aminobutyrate hydrolase family protein [Acidobacteria bacterium]|nr:gamma-glutamyl-gamma-aminobutyrate hydrolase family protein [Acidobacteriota bacterium]